MALSPLARIQQAAGRITTLPRTRFWAVAASTAWIVLVLAYGLGFWSVASGTGILRFLDIMFLLMALVLPVMLIWLAAWLADTLAQQREIVAALAEAALPLSAALAATRSALDHHTAATTPMTPDAVTRAVHVAMASIRQPDVVTPLERLLAGQARAEVSLQRLAARAPAALAPAEEAPTPSPAAVAEPARVQAAPAAPTAPEADEDGPSRPDWPTLIRALDFPRDGDDQQGFAALRTALRHPSLAQMLQAAEDVLTLLSQEGVFVDDLPMQPVDAAVWRRFMAGTRGPEVAALGGITDPAALDTARRLVRTDAIFRDTALFFQRRFDSVLVEFAAGADDEAIAELAGTRSGRAFMLLVHLNAPPAQA